MTTIGMFERPVGALVDVRELEYISYLHQAGYRVRPDCSIKDKDIVAYLMSRYGITVPVEAVHETILKGLGGSADKNEVIDLMELTAMLLIPVLLKASKTAGATPEFQVPLPGETASSLLDTIRSPENASSSYALEGSATKDNRLPHQTSKEKIRNPLTKTKSAPRENTNEKKQANNRRQFNIPFYKLFMYLRDRFKYEDEDDDYYQYDADVFDNDDVGDDEDDQPTLLPNLFYFIAKVITHDITNSGTPKRLNADFVRDILMKYGENDLADDTELIQEMVKCARTSPRRPEDADVEEVEAPEKIDLKTLNGRTLANATTNDVLKYDISNENKMSTLYDDVFPPEKKLMTAENRAENDIQHSNSVLERTFTAPAIDITAGTFRSKPLMVLLWTTAILTFCVFYINRFYDLYEEPEGDCNVYNMTTIEALRRPWIKNYKAIGCTLSTTVKQWIMLFFTVGILGMAYTGGGSIGNTIECTKWWHPFIGCVPIFTAAVLQLNYIDRETSKYVSFLAVFAFLLSFLVIYLHVTHSTSILVSDEYMEKHPSIRNWLPESKIAWLQSVLSPRMIEDELMGKKAMAYKLNNMAENALKLVIAPSDSTTVIDTYCGRALHEFSRRGISKKELVGGPVWTWKNMYNKHLFDREGIRFSVRVLASNIGQFIVCFFLLYAGYNFYKEANEIFDVDRRLLSYTYSIIDYEVRKGSANMLAKNMTTYFSNTSGTINIDCSRYEALLSNNSYALCKKTDDGEMECADTTQIESFCTLAHNNFTGISNVSLESTDGSDFNLSNVEDMTIYAFGSAINATVERYSPTQEYMILVPVVFGVAVAFLSAMLLATQYLSFVASIIMRLRCGVIPTLQTANTDFYRWAPDTVALLTGSVFWSCLVSSVLCGTLAGSIVFIFLWQWSVFVAQYLVALIISLLTIWLIKLLILCFIRRKIYAGYFRMKPAYANLVMLGMEWANFTLSAGIIFIRMIKLLFMSTFSIGRIYQPFLAPDMNRVGPFEIDGYPTIHMTELLSHEAHRHPYIEFLGYMYLMKLRYSNEFGSRAGSCWRLIFIHALMPWLRTYRVRAYQDTVDFNLVNPYIAFISIRNFPTPLPTRSFIEDRPFSFLTDDRPESILEVTNEDEEERHDNDPSVSSIISRTGSF